MPAPSAPEPYYPQPAPAVAPRMPDGPNMPAMPDIAGMDSAAMAAGMPGMAGAPYVAPAPAPQFSPQPIPQMSQIPQAPQMPQMPQMPQAPQTPHMPQAPRQAAAPPMGPSEPIPAIPGAETPFPLIGADRADGVHGDVKDWMDEEPGEARGAETGERGRRRFLVLCVLFLTAAVFLTWSHIRRNSFDYLSREAAGLYQQGRYAEAMAVYRRGYESYPNSAVFLTGLAHSAEGAGDFPAAIRAWEIYLGQLSEEDVRDRAEALYRMAHVYVAMGEHDAAISSLTQSTKLVSTRYDAYMLMGRLLEGQGREEEAVEAYRLALEVSPSSSEADGAVKRLRSAIRSDAPSAGRDLRRILEQRLEVGVVALNLKRYDDAISYFSQALAIREDDERPWLGLAGAHQGKGDLDAALKAVRDAQKKCPASVTLEAKLQELEAARAEAVQPRPKNPRNSRR